MIGTNRFVAWFASRAAKIETDVDDGRSRCQRLALAVGQGHAIAVLLRLQSRCHPLADVDPNALSRSPSGVHADDSLAIDDRDRSGWLFVGNIENLIGELLCAQVNRELIPLAKRLPFFDPPIEAATARHAVFAAYLCDCFAGCNPLTDLDRDSRTEASLTSHVCGSLMARPTLYRALSRPRPSSVCGSKRDNKTRRRMAKASVRWLEPEAHHSRVERHISLSHHAGCRKYPDRYPHHEAASLQTSAQLPRCLVPPPVPRVSTHAGRCARGIFKLPFSAARLIGALTPQVPVSHLVLLACGSSDSPSSPFTTFRGCLRFQLSTSARQRSLSSDVRGDFKQGAYS
jgi:hypothetical protein